MSKPGSEYYKGAFRYVIDGVPCRFPRKLSAHALAVLRSKSYGSQSGSPIIGHAAELRKLAETRYPQTQYEMFPAKPEKAVA